jgi:dUTP pyrophosphatase
MGEQPNLNPSEINFTVWPSVMGIKVAKVDKSAILPTRKFPTDAGMDVYALFNTLVLPHSNALVRTGITVEIPQSYFGLLKPKGRAIHLVGAGVVDESYQGEIIVRVFNPTEQMISFLAGQPVAQLIIVPVVCPQIVEVDETEVHRAPTDRGETGGIHGA